MSPQTQCLGYSQDKLERNRRGALHRATAHEYPLSGVLICAGCGHKYRGGLNISNHREGIKKRWYRCNAKFEHNIECDNPSVKADEIEPQIFVVIEKLITHPEIKEGRIERVDAEGMEDNLVLRIRKSDIEAKLQQNLAEQQKLNQSFRKGVLAEEAYDNEAIDLRRQEKELKSQLNTVHMAFIKKEHSELYQRKLKRLLSEFDASRETVDITTKKEMLQFVFKEILIKDKKIVTIDFYHPFSRYWKELECNITQVTTMRNENSSLLKPTADRWCRYRTTILKLLKMINSLK